MTCSKYINFTPWAGKRVVFIAHDVMAMRQLMWTTADLEGLNLVSAGVSDEAKDQLRLADKRNSRLTGEALTIVFHSGSSLEMICRDYIVEVEE